MNGLLHAVVPWVAALVGMVLMEVLMEGLGDAMSRASQRTKTVVQVSWWLFTAAAAWGATAWFLEDPASDLRTKVAMFSCVGLPGLGALLTAMAGLPPRIEGRFSLGILPWRRRARAGVGVTRDGRPRRD